ncbi:MAG: hypothetical protein HQL96_13490 [Magnetococcales bacterium]|nr:hypothetical protein [Magnetococcales bacterium]
METCELVPTSLRLLALGNIQECIDMVTRDMEVGNVSIKQLLTRAVAHMRLFQFPESLADCDEAMRIDPENRQLYFIRGAVFRRMGRLQDAIANLTQAIDIHPEYGIAYLERALCYTACGRQEEADHDLQITLMYIETALRGLCDSICLIHPKLDAMEETTENDWDYSRIFLSCMQIEEMKQTFH